MRPRDPEAGFTLVEALVAMAVLAAGAVTLMTATERHASLARGLADRTIARWAASNRLVEITLGLDTGAGSVTLMGTAWRVTSDVSPTSDPDLVRVDVTAEQDETMSTTGSAVRLTGFVDAVTLKER